jgi:chromate reductase, NAD(P)H dehydrogenase (quinone)
VVGSGELIDKPVALINTSPRATHAQASLMETISVMSGRIIPDASIVVPLAGRSLDAADIAAMPELAERVVTALIALAHAANVACHERVF